MSKLWGAVQDGGGLMGEKRDKTLYEWIVLIIKLLRV